MGPSCSIWTVRWSIPGAASWRPSAAPSPRWAANRASFAKVLGAGADAEKALGAYRARYVDGEGMYDADVYDGVPDALAALAGRSRLFVCTSKPEPFARKVVAHFGLSRFIERVYGAGLDAALDDKADLMAHLLASEGLAPAKCVMVGDRRFDVEAGARNHVATVGVLWGYGDVAELQGASRLCARPKDLAADVSGLAERRGGEHI